jgi:hypothetical protein
MKNLGLIGLMLLFIVFGSCKKNQKPNEEGSNNVPAEKPVSVQCYKAIYENDTIDLKINTLKSGGVDGDMVMKLENMPVKNGKIVGDFHGDTLMLSYTFTQGDNKNITFKNPMAFLKKADTLVLGNGKIITSMGASYFAKGEPIDFEHVKYKFTSVDCVDK